MRANGRGHTACIAHRWEAQALAMGAPILFRATTWANYEDAFIDSSKRHPGAELKPEKLGSIGPRPSFAQAPSTPLPTQMIPAAATKR
jgi:hypothetical protein